VLRESLQIEIDSAVRTVDELLTPVAESGDPEE
jgi:hypothetical protein